MPGRNVLSEITGDKDIAKILETIVPSEANNLLRSTTHGIATEINKKARRNARARGLPIMAKALKSKRKKSPPNKPVSEVFVEHGSGAKNDAWWWHFHEFGTAPRFTKSGKSAGRIPERPMIRPAFKSVMSNLPSTIREQFQKKLQKRIAARQKQMAKKS